MHADLLGYRFKRIELGDRERITALLARHPQPLSDYTFGSLVAWSPVYRYRFAFPEAETLLISSWSGRGSLPTLLQPVGAFSHALQAELLTRARSLATSLRIEAVSEEFVEHHAAFVAHFDVVPQRDCANYVYAAHDLAELHGRRYAGKRNLIAQASRLYTLTAEPLDQTRAEACLEIGEDIARKRTCRGAVTLEQETQALATALRSFGPLGLQGVLVRIAGRPAAFSIFDRLSPSAAVVLFERARRSDKGLYQVVNQETARVIAASGFTIINREEDLGDAGLRRAKLSYHPVSLEMKHTLTLRGSPSARREGETTRLRHASPQRGRREVGGNRLTHEDLAALVSRPTWRLVLTRGRPRA